jgi:hypothetical protein
VFQHFSVLSGVYQRYEIKLYGAPSSVRKWWLVAGGCYAKLRRGPQRYAEEILCETLRFLAVLSVTAISHIIKICYLQPPVHNVLIEEAFDVEDDGAGLFIF